MSNILKKSLENADKSPSKIIKINNMAEKYDSKNSNQLLNTSFGADELHCHVTNKEESEKFKNRNAIATKKLIIVLLLCTLFMIGEIIGGLLANSISIQTDAAHLASDIVGFFLNIIAIFLSENSYSI
jgi:hypothetical protein